MSNQLSVPFDRTHYVRDHCLCLAAQRTARRLARRFDEALRPVGLTSGQFSLLMSLNRPQPPSMGAVAATLAMDRTTLTSNLKPLERRGLVERGGDPADKRAKLLRLTEEGGKLLAAALPIWRLTHDEIDGEMPDGSCADLRSALAILS
jgi:DNA-binding MarR family transcriptional regulator